MVDRDSELEQNPYMTSFYKNPPPPASRPINTNRAPNPYHPGQDARHIRNESRLGTYSLHSEADMVRFAEQPSSALIAAATGPSPFQKSRPRTSSVGELRRANNAGNYEPAQKSSKSNKRRYIDRDSSSELSDHEDDDFSPATMRRLAPIPAKQRKSQRSGKQRKTQQYLSNDDHNEEKHGDHEEFDQDAEEEQALERYMARRQAQKTSSPSFKTPASKKREHEAHASAIEGMLYPTPPGNTSSLKKKPKGKPVPQDLKTADIADRMMFRWKNAGRPWDEIRDEYYRLTGTKPAASSLSVRFIKLNENLAANGFKDEIHDSFFETYPNKKYLKNFTKRSVQEVAILKAVAEAKIKTSQPFWKEAVIQFKELTGEDFAASSMRKRYEDIEKRQFYLGEQNPSKDIEWPPLQGFKNGRKVFFRSMQVLDPSCSNMDNTVAGHAHGQYGGRHNIANNTYNNSPFEDQTMGDADDIESVGTENGQENSSMFTNGKGKGRDVSHRSHSAIEFENESPSHSHPQINYGDVDYTKDMVSDGSVPGMGMNPNTPTPAPTMGAALIGTGFGRGLSVGPRPSLVGYGSDDSD